MSAPERTDASDAAPSRPGVLLLLALPLVLVAVAAMFYEMVGSSHNDNSLEASWYFGSAALVAAAALALASIVSVHRQRRPSLPWWIVIAWLLCLVAGGFGLWGLSLPLLDRISEQTTLLSDRILTRRTSPQSDWQYGCGWGDSIAVETTTGNRRPNVAVKLTRRKFRCEAAGENSYSSSHVKVLDWRAAYLQALCGLTEC